MKLLQRTDILPAVPLFLSLMLGDALAGPDDREVEVNGLAIHYLDWGSEGRQPLILLHGIGRSAHTFDHIADLFTGDHHVLAVDLRGHGESAWDQGGAYEVEDYAADMAAFIVSLDLRDVVLWGNSTGGRVVQVLAALQPERVAAVIVEDVGPERPPAIADRLEDQIRREEQGWDSREALLEELLAASPGTRAEVLRPHVTHGSRLRDDGRIIWKRDPSISRGFVPTDLWRFVAEIRAPIIYILGGGSPIVPVETQIRLKEVLPRAEVITMPGLGHYPSEEQPEEFAGIVKRFLSDQAAR